MSRRARTNLPAAVTSFVGRSREIAEALALLRNARLVTVTGVGGVGKTRLALQLAERCLDAFEDGVWFADLSPVTDAAQVAATVVRALGLSDPSTRGAEDRLIDYLRERQALLVIDNCEHLVSASARLITRILREAAGVRVLATSRAHLDAEGEYVLPIAPLDVPDMAFAGSVAELSSVDAVGLFLERAAASVHGFTLTEANSASVARLCARLDGLPLAIELAAPRLRSLTIDQLAERLDDRFAILTHGTAQALPRQRTLRALIDWSYELCSSDERLLWSRLAVFTGGFTLAAAEGVCAVDDAQPGHIVDSIDSIDALVAQSVLTLVASEGEPRYRMLETIRRYGWERLIENGEQERMLARHAVWFADLAVTIEGEWFGPGQESQLARLRIEHENLTAALGWLIEQQDTERALHMFAALRYYWCADGFLGQGRRWAEAALTLPNPPASALMHGLVVASWVMLLQGDYEAADVRLGQCGALAARLGEEAVLAVIDGWRGSWALFHGDLETAERQFSTAVDRLSDLGEEPRALISLFQLANTRSHAANPEAQAAARRAIGISERLGERWTRSYALWALGLDAWLRGDNELATSSTTAALSIQTGFNDHVGAALMIELVAWTAASRGQYERAARLLGAVGAIWRVIGTDVSSFGPHLARLHERCERDVAAALAEPALDGLRSWGAALDHDSAVLYALDRRAVPEHEENAVLTRRERQIASLVAEGLTNRQIAERLVISIRTVDTHVQNVLARLGLSSRAQIAVWVVEHR